MIEPPAKPVTPLVSILVNNYNYGHFVVEAAASALSQTWSRIEVIVVDDGSTDDSLQRLQAIDDPRLQVIAQPNGGQGAAYNTGFERSRGEFVIFLDADDTLERTVVERALRPPVVRRRTKVPKSAVARRLAGKRHRGETKSLRRRPAD